MLNPIVSSIVYAAEMLIIFIFFNRISEKKLPILKSFFIGILLFEFGSFINLVFQMHYSVSTLVGGQLFVILSRETNPDPPQSIFLPPLGRNLSHTFWVYFHSGWR